MRLVLDPATMAAAIRSDAGVSRRLLAAGLRRRLTLLASLPLMMEYQAVITRPEHLEASGLTTRQANTLLDAVAAVAEPVRLTFLWRPRLRAPDHDMILEAAVTGQADAIVTFDLLAADDAIEVLAPNEAWQRVRTRR